MTTYSAKLNDIKRKWWIVDAEGLVVGRAATIIANVLRGKNKPMYSPNLDCGDNIVVINAGKVKMTGKKLADKVYYKHTGYPGGIKETTPGKILSGSFPERVLEKAVERMIPGGPLGRKVIKKLHVYTGAEHPHTAQNPEVLNIAAMNPKNKRS